jgi:hypothetical protein
MNGNAIVRIYHDGAQQQLDFPPTSTKNERVFYQFGSNIIPESILVLAGGIPHRFTVKYSQSTAACLEYYSPASGLPIRISWLTTDFSWTALHQGVETKTGDCHVSSYGVITNNSDRSLRFNQLFLINASLMRNNAPRYFEKSRGLRSAPMMSRNETTDNEEIITGLAAGESRSFEVKLWSAELAVGTTMTPLATDDIKIRDVIFLFDIDREGDQFPRLTLLVKANNDWECPAGRLDFYDEDTMLLGGGDLKDLAPGEKTYLCIANTRRIEANITREQDKVQDTDVISPKGTITKKFTVTVSIENTTKHQFSVGFVLPTNGRNFSDFMPKPDGRTEQGPIWIRTVDEEIHSLIRYTETVDRE